MDKEISDAISKFLTSKEAPTSACGGSIPIAPASDIVFGESHASPPVTIRRDTKDGDSDTGKKISFPLADHDKDRLASLVKDCTPAAFGKDNEDVLDPEYRSAVALDTSRFSVDFDPHRLGIIDQIQRILVPPILELDDDKAAKRSAVGSLRSLSAELYKLNISPRLFSFFFSLEFPGLNHGCSLRGASVCRSTRRPPASSRATSTLPATRPRLAP